MRRRSLTEIANYYATDKGTIGPSNTWTTHNYTDVYEAYLAGYRDKPINFLEIGMGVTGAYWRSDIVHGRNGGGASIRMWHDYFECASIYGIDINPWSPDPKSERIKTFVADQGSPSALQDFIAQSGVTEFDFIVDDGSHRPEHQQLSFSFLFKYLKSGGLYFIEDICANGLGDGAAGRMSNNEVLSTRNVLSGFGQADAFPSPNAFIDASSLALEIDDVRFHVPEVHVRYALNKSMLRPIKRVVLHLPGTEKLCVIRKR